MKQTNTKGFTLLEALLASAIFGIVFAQLFTTIVFCRRLIEETMRETDLALQSRSLRERLLFRLDSQAGGLLSAPYNSLHGDTVRLQYSLGGVANSIYYDDDNLKATNPLKPFGIPYANWLNFTGVTFSNSNNTWDVKNEVKNIRTATFRFYLTPGTKTTKDLYLRQTIPLTMRIPAFGRTVLATDID